MKDFAKSIRVANAKDKNGKDVNVGDLVKVKTDDPSLTLGKVKSVSGETIKVDMTGDDDIWKTPARLVEKVGNKKVGNSQKLYSDANVEIYDDGIVKLSHFPGYTQWAKDVDSIVRDEIRALETQISDLKNAASKVKEIGKKYGLL